MTTNIPRETKKIYITGEINDTLANEIQLMLLNEGSTIAPLRMIINSKGGERISRTRNNRCNGFSFLSYRNGM